MPATKLPAKTVAKVRKEPVVTPESSKLNLKKGSLSVPVLTLAGKSSETLNLPAEIFGAKVNKSLLSQAIRVYSTNQKAHWGHTKTRGEVSMTTAKVYRQKGTGNARHGAKSAPIFVKGGIAFGPKYRKTVLELPKKMKKAALVSALSQKILDGEILALADLEKATGKTKQMVSLIRELGEENQKVKSVLIVNDQKLDSASRAIQNLQSVSFLTVDQLNAFEVIKHQSLLLTKAAVEKLQKGPQKTKESKVATK